MLKNTTMICIIEVKVEKIGVKENKNENKNEKVAQDNH